MGTKFGSIAYGLQDMSGYSDPARRSTGKRRIIPPEILRQNAMASYEGGRGYCEECKHTFSMTYIRHCFIHMRNVDLCVDCKKKLGAQTVA
jgi:hypothetical protein